MELIHQYRVSYIPAGHPELALRTLDGKIVASTTLPTAHDAKTVIKLLRHNNTALYSAKDAVLMVTNTVAQEFDSVVDSPKKLPLLPAKPSALPIPGGISSTGKLPSRVLPLPTAPHVETWGTGYPILGYVGMSNFGTWVPSTAGAFPGDPGTGSYWKPTIDPQQMPVKHNLVLDLGKIGLHWISNHNDYVLIAELRFLLWLLRTVKPFLFHPQVKGLTSEWQHVGTHFPNYPSSLLKQHPYWSATGKQPQSLAEKLDGSNITPTPNLANWLADHPKIAQAITLDHDGGPTSYPAWVSGPLQKYRNMLQDAFSAAWIGKPWTWEDPPRNLKKSASPITVVSGEIGQTIFFSYVAHCLTLELKKTLPWSIVNYPQSWLDLLFDSRNFFSWNAKGQTYATGTDFKPWFIITPGLPQNIYAFITASKILQTSQLSTVVAFIDWCRSHLNHTVTAGGYHLMEYWGYVGAPPASKIIQGTYGAPAGFPPKFGHYIAGCRNMMGFIHAVLKTINIPVEDVQRLGSQKYHKVKGHAQVYFPSIDRFLAHADDAFLRLASIPPIPSIELLTLPTDFNGLFAASETSPEQALTNLGKLVADLTFKYVPLSAMFYLCKFGAETAAEYMKHPVLGKEFSPYWSYQQQSEFFSKLKGKVSVFGGCGVVRKFWVVVDTDGQNFS